VDEITDETGTKVICEKSIGCFIYSHKYYHGRRWSRAIWSNGGGESAIIQSWPVKLHLTRCSFTVTDVS